MSILDKELWRAWYIFLRLKYATAWTKLSDETQKKILKVIERGINYFIPSTFFGIAIAIATPLSYIESVFFIWPCLTFYEYYYWWTREGWKEQPFNET